MVLCKCSNGWSFHFSKPSNGLASIRNWEWSLNIYIQWEVTSIRFLVVKRKPENIILSNPFPNNNPIVYGRYLWIQWAQPCLRVPRVNGCLTWTRSLNFVWDSILYCYANIIWFLTPPFSLSNVIVYDRLPRCRTIVMEISSGKTKYVLLFGLRNGLYSGTFDLWLVSCQ